MTINFDDVPDVGTTKDLSFDDIPMAGEVKQEKDYKQELYEMSMPERSARLATGLIPGAVETFANIAGSIPTYAWDVAQKGFKQFAQGKSKDQAEQEIETNKLPIRRKWDETLAPETYAGKGMNELLSNAFSTAIKATGDYGAYGGLLGYALNPNQAKTDPEFAKRSESGQTIAEMAMAATGVKQVGSSLLSRFTKTKPVIEPQIKETSLTDIVDQFVAKSQGRLAVLDPKTGKWSEGQRPAELSPMPPQETASAPETPLEVTPSRPESVMETKGLDTPAELRGQDAPEEVVAKAMAHVQDTVNAKLADKGVSVEFTEGQHESLAEPTRNDLLNFVHNDAPVELSGIVKNEAGETVGHVELVKSPDGTYEIRDINTEKAGKGVGTNLVQGLVDAGIPLKPSEFVTEAGKGMQKKIDYSRHPYDQEGPNIIKLNNITSTEDIVKTAKMLVNVAKNAAHFADMLADKYGEAVRPYAAAMYDQAKKEAPRDAAVRNIEEGIRKTINGRSATNRITTNNRAKIEKTIPDLPAREIISSAIEQGKIGELAEGAQKIATFVKSLFDDIGERAKEAGTIKDMLENYVTHIVDWSKIDPTAVESLKEHLFGKAMQPSGGFLQSSRFGKARKYSTFEALQEAIKDTGLEIKTKDIAEIYQTYANSMETAIANKNLASFIKETTGENLLVKLADKKAPQGWTQGIQGFREYAVSPEIAQQLKYISDKIDPNAWLEAAHGLSQLVKRLNVFGSFFHAKSLVEVLYGNTGIFSTIKELGALGLDKIAGTQMSGITQALKMLREGGLGDVTDRFIRENLVLSIPEDVTLGIIGKVGAAADELIGKFGPKTEVLGKTLGTIEKYTVGILDKVTWEYAHAGSKLMVALKMLEKAKIDHPEVPENVHMREIANHLNNSYGGMNWFEAATQSSTKLGKELALGAYSPKGRMAMQILMFAPDWTISTIKAFTSALPKLIKFEEGKMKLDPEGFNIKKGVEGIWKPKNTADFARRYQLRVIVMYATLFNAIQYQISGHWIWENDDPTRLEFPDGTSVQVAKHASEATHWFTDPDKTFMNKLGFIPRVFAVGGLGKEYASPHAPDLADRSFAGRLEATGKMMLPFQATSAMNAPEGEGLGRALASEFGFPVFGMTKDQKQQQNKETNRTKAEQYKEWKRKQH